MNFIPVDKIEWKKVKYLRQGESLNYDYEFWLNEPLASWDVWDYWERERIESMRTHLEKGDVLFDIGTESGWCNLVYAQMVGPENMVLIEPTPEFWPNIKALWEKNYPGINPKGFYDGFFSDKTTEMYGGRMYLLWPRVSNGDLIDRNSYRYLSDENHREQVAEITIDDYVYRTGIVPDALTMDVEGAELLILKGAEETLRKYNLKVWVSQHNELALRDYSIKPGEIETCMESLGYKSEFLAKDHEIHKFYYKE